MYKVQVLLDAEKAGEVGAAATAPQAPVAAQETTSSADEQELEVPAVVTSEAAKDAAADEDSSDAVEAAYRCAD